MFVHSQSRVKIPSVVNMRDGGGGKEAILFY